jgi:hypothetical protein
MFVYRLGHTLHLVTLKNDQNVLNKVYYVDAIRAIQTFLCVCVCVWGGPAADATDAPQP